MQQIFLAIGAFVVVAVVVVLIGFLATGKSKTRERLERYTGTAEQAPLVQTQGPTDSLPTVSRILSSRGLTEKLMLDISRAGLKWRPSEFAVMVAAWTILPVFILFILHMQPVVIILAGLLGFCVPVVYLKAKQGARMRAFNNQIADALSLMASSLRSGYSFMRAMQVVSSEMPPPISEEFGRVIDECNVGVPTEDALMHLVQRVQSYDMELVVTAVTIQIQLGGNLAEILDTIAETIRERVRINGEVAALTADGRLSGIILIALPICLGCVIYTLSPGYLTPLLTQHTGKMLMLGAVVSTVFGALIIRKMLQIDF
jgi:tight adherence protein B